jgi:hypothetical protein
MDRAGGGLQFAGDQFYDSGLTGTGGAHQKSKLAVLDLHGNAPQGLISHRIGLDDVNKFDHTSLPHFRYAVIVSQVNFEVNCLIMYKILNFM